MRHRSRPFLALIPAAAVLGGAAPVADCDVSVSVIGMRSAKGQVLACLTTRPDAFPDCTGDPQARKLAVAAAPNLQLDFGPVPVGHYAISLIHDENGNGRLDTRLMIPREGFGFSRDAPARFGPPSFDRAVFAVDGAGTHLAIKMRYLL